MLKQLFVFLALCLAVEGYTRVKINNYCSQQLSITEGDELKPLSVICTLKAGSSCYKDYSLNDKTVNFQNGWAKIATRVGINFNDDSFDPYAIDTFNGFDLAVDILSNRGGGHLVCENAKCQTGKSYHYENVTTNGVFTINFCFNSVATFESTNGQKELPLVESAHNPIKSERQKFEVEREFLAKNSKKFNDIKIQNLNEKMLN